MIKGFRSVLTQATKPFYDVRSCLFLEIMRKFLVVVGTLFLAACAPSAVIRESWRAPQVAVAKVSPMAVLSATGSPAQRQAHDNAVVAELARHGVNAATGEEVLPLALYDKNNDGKVDADLNRDAIRQALTAKGYRTG